MIGKSLLCVLTLGTVAVLNLGADVAVAEEAIVMGPVEMMAPDGWEKKQPRVRIIEYEYAVPAVEGDDNDGRMTVMLAGGSVDDNIERWYGQFKQPGGGDTAKAANVEEKKIADHDVHLVDISGTYLDRRGPAAPAVARENYRMIAAIIETDKGNYFIKFYGPKNTMAENEKAFAKMIEGLKTR